jgi:uncharacterized protein DUF4190/uncharacterized protein DUF4339
VLSDGWYYGSATNRQGPVHGTRLQELVKAGWIRRETLIWREEWPTWRPAGQFPFLFATQHEADPALGLLVPTGPQSGLAIAAGYCGIFSIFPVLAPVAIILGVLALKDLKAHPEKKGAGRAITGIVLGTFVSVVVLLLIIAAVLK